MELINAILSQLTGEDKVRAAKLANELSAVRRAELKQIEDLKAEAEKPKDNLPQVTITGEGRQSVMRANDLPPQPLSTEPMPPMLVEEDEDFEGTKELKAINEELKNNPHLIPFQRIEQGINLFPKTVEEVDPNTLTKADYEAGQQLLRGEPPTANIYENYLTGAVAEQEFKMFSQAPPPQEAKPSDEEIMRLLTEGVPPPSNNNAEPVMVGMPNIGGH